MSLCWLVGTSWRLFWRDLNERLNPPVGGDRLGQIGNRDGVLYESNKTYLDVSALKDVEF